MAIRKPSPKPKPKPKAEPIPAPNLAPIDLVRNPNFDAAMVQQKYNQILADMTARAKAGQFDPIREVISNDFRASQGPQAFQDEIFRRNALMGYQKQTYGSYVNQPEQQGFGDVAGTMSSAGQLPSQQPFNPNAPSLMPIQTGGSMIGSIGDQRNIYNNLQPYVSQVGYVQMPNQKQQMQNYQNFLQQGMQSSNTLNQGAMNNFTNMQPGMQAMPPASNPAQKKLSTPGYPSPKPFG
jgi:hypothetical protein